MQVNGPDQVMGLYDDGVYRQTIARMFRPGPMEFFSRVHPVVPALLFGPIAAAFAVTSLTEHVALVAGASLAAGLFLWTLAEYTLHRFAFHIEPRGPVTRFLYVYLHGIHHHYPDDPYRLVMVPVISVPLAIAFYFGFSLILPADWLPGVYAGFVFGYLGYDYSHYFTHHGRVPSHRLLTPLAAVMKIQRRRHMRHHFADHSNGFGVSVGLWDRVFGTVDPKG